jgi:nucleoside-diphosphate-sugar epimerase
MIEHVEYAVIDSPSAFAGQRVLVTGGAGVIAREVLERLSKTDAAILSIDRLPLTFEAPASVDHVVADLADVDLGDVRDFDPTVILHLAATFERSVETPEFWEQNWSDNVVVTHRLCDLAAKSRSVRAFVFASSYLVYRSSQYLQVEPRMTAVALTEDAEQQPRNLCGAAKAYGEAELGFVQDVIAARLRCVSARIFRVYGRGSRDVVSRWVRAALRGEPIEVYQPENRFDYVYSGDVAEGLLRMAADPAASGVLNLATGRDRSVAEVVEAIEAATGRSFDRRDVLVDGPYEASRADLTRLRGALGWSPTATLEDGVRALVEHEAGAHVGA